jgi:SNF2 family DNA or RNA helicase
VLAPTWWDSPAARLGVRLKIESPVTLEGVGLRGGAGAGGGPARVGLMALVNYKWQISLGQATLSIDEFQRLAQLKSPLVYVGGRWVEVRPEDIKAAVAFIRENPGGEIEVGKALRLAFAADTKATGVPVVGLDATGWAAAIFGGTGTGEQQKNFSMPMLDAPPGFVGSLRPYQVKGLSWLAFLDRLGLGSCLADDMGLGKTIQLLAMLLHERVGYYAELRRRDAAALVAAANGQAVEPAAGAVGVEPGQEAGAFDVGPTLLIVPMSVVSNWVRETRRFAPSLRVLVHHGAERARGPELIDAAHKADLVVTTYALAHRDRDDLEKVVWHRVALDEAQNIKNPVTKQTRAVRSIEAPRRIALTGTPVENRLTELWSIMDFLNPGLLGSGAEFRSRFAMGIEKYNDAGKGKQLRSLIQPFVLRRLKTDPQVIADLPEKVETKEFCYLTPEQASLYEQVVKGMLQQAESSDGVQRRGVILAGLTKLKQVCNHPLHYLRHDLDPDGAPVTAVGPAPSQRSGKCTRLVQMLDEVVASGGQALVFTQFRAMGEMLAATLRHELDREVLLLHGGTSAKDRDAMVQRFQKGDGSAPVFVLSLKAGGVGLNLTAANHVFHFDRWWNPAVENQATDRAFRIGQTRTVQVHKFVVAGTLEEKIDQMIEAKASLADNVIGSGEAWLTELSLSQLRDVLTLRQDAVEPLEALEE